jgi:hypothetical protein
LPPFSAFLAYSAKRIGSEGPGKAKKSTAILPLRAATGTSKKAPRDLYFLHPLPTGALHELA